MLRKLTLFVFVSAIAVSALALGANDSIRVEGGLISGAAADGVRSFKGIPFAAPPVGDLRWKSPQPVVAWEEFENVRQSDPSAHKPRIPPRRCTTRRRKSRVRIVST